MRDFVRGVGLAWLPMLAACQWFLSEQAIFEAKDRDADGFASILAGGEDCDDADPSVNPGAPEVCDDGLDNDCNGVTDDLGEGFVAWFVDADGDGYGTRTGQLRNACPGWLTGTGWAPNDTDCNDADPLVHPGERDDTCNGVDNDCDGIPDDDAGIRYADVDGDGFGDPSQPLTCDDLPGTSADNTDCDDNNAHVYVGALEVCDGVDNDCDGYADDAWVATVGVTNFTDFVAAAKSAIAAGDDLQICAGEHVVQGLFHEGPDTLRIVGPAGRDATTLIEANGGRLVHWIGAVLEIEGVEIRGSDKTQSIRSESGTLRVTNARLTGSHSGVYASAHTSTNDCGPPPDSALYVTGTTLSDMTSVGVFAGCMEQVEVVDCEFSDSAGAGLSVGGLFVGAPESVLVRDSTFIRNQNSAIHVLFSDLTVSGSVFEDNRGLSGAAISNLASSGLRIVDSTFDGNAADDGGAVFVRQLIDPLVIESTTFHANSADQGGAIYAGYSTSDPVNTDLRNVDFGTGINENTADDIFIQTNTSGGGASHDFSGTVTTFCRSAGWCE